MAQLSDDCFAFNGPLLPVADAERLIAERVAPVAGHETVPLREAAGRVLADDVVAPVNVPPFDNSAVDGYAVRAGDLESRGEMRLKIVDRVAAGHDATHAVQGGEAIRIFTGAPMPAGADTVFMQEDCRVEGGAVIVPPGLKIGANRRSPAKICGPARLRCRPGGGSPCSTSRSPPRSALPRLTVRRRVCVALFSTGDEIVEPGSLCRAPRSMIQPLSARRPLARFGAEVTDLGILSDEPAALAQALKIGGGRA